MAPFTRFMFLFAAIACLSIAAPLIHSEPPPPVWPPPVINGTLPENDDFYKAPVGFEKAPAGSILRFRRVPGTIAVENNITVNVQAAWQLQYRTQNSVGDPEASIVTVLVPHNQRPGNVFMYSYYTLTPYNGCNPSITQQAGTREDNVSLQGQVAAYINALHDGIIVGIADDTGPKGAFSAGPGTAYRTLDSVRAIKQSGHITGVAPDPIVTMYGYSNGGTVVAWAAELQPSYAPDVKIAGIAVGGVVANSSYLMEARNGKPWSMFGPPTLIGLAHDYQNLSDWIGQNLKPERAKEFLLPEKACFGSFYGFDNHDTGEYFKRGFASIKDPVPDSVIKAAGTLGVFGTPRVPVFMFHSVADDASPIHLVDALYDKYCKAGANIRFERTTLLLSHSESLLFAFAHALKWLNDRHDGKPITESGCNSIDPVVDWNWLMTQGPFVDMKLNSWLVQNKNLTLGKPNRAKTPS